MTIATDTLPDCFDFDCVTAAGAVADAAIEDLLGGGPRPRAVVVTAPAGAGKSHLISTAVERAGERGLRVAVAAPTNEQAFGLVRTIALRQYATENHRPVTFLPASGVTLPTSIATIPGVQCLEAKNAAACDLVVGTLSKLGDACARGYLRSFDILMVDEAYQADSGRYFGVAGLAPVHLLVGDSGQISPFSTIADPDRWRGLAEDPLQTAVALVLRNHPGTPVYRLPISRRLDARAVGIARLFYPDLRFDAAVRPGVRELRLRREIEIDPRLDRALDSAARDGWVHVELPCEPVLQSDAEAATLVVDLVARLFDRAPRVRCERNPDSLVLGQKRVAVGVSHNDQKDRIRVALDERGLSDVVVETANKLQGLEFDVVFVWHPLSGLCEADEFHLDPGRFCVLLTRHRHACVVVGREGVTELLDERPPPPSVAYLGRVEDPMMDGWEIHRTVYDRLGRYRGEGRSSPRDEVRSE